MDLSSAMGTLSLRSSSAEKTKLKGVVSWYDAKKGFGFIDVRGMASQVFAHWSEIQPPEGFRSLVEGEDVEFYLHIDNGKKQAKHIIRDEAFVNALQSERVQDFTPDEWPVGVKPSDGKYTGYVKQYNCEKGYGFITSEQFSKDIFVHNVEIVAEPDTFRSLRVGEAVEFNAEQEYNGDWKAYDVAGPGGEYVQGAPRKRNYRRSYR